MKIAVAIACILLVCSGCSMTVTGTAKWSDAVTAAPESVPQAQYDKMLAGAQAFGAEIQAVQSDTNAVNAVLRKYGIER